MVSSGAHPSSGNLFFEPGADRAAERCEDLLVAEGVRIERIVSLGQATEPGVWLEQDEAEWVVLLSGAAGLRFDDGSAERRMRAGDWLFIPARCRHRVEWTQEDVASVWLAVHVTVPA